MFVNVIKYSSDVSQTVNWKASYYEDEDGMETEERITFPKLTHLYILMSQSYDNI